MHSTKYYIRNNFNIINTNVINTSILAFTYPTKNNNFITFNYYF